MGYTLTIGEAKMELPEEPDRSITVGVERLEREDAPEFPGDGTTGKSNQRSPSYTVWTQVMRDLLLYDWMFDTESGIIRDHPGCVMLRREDQRIVTEARQRWQREHPETEPGWCSCVGCHVWKSIEAGTSLEPHRELDGVLARVLWLEWWITWALDHCAVPAFENS